MDEDESKEIIVHKNLSENLSKDVSESECNIVHENLSQKNSTDAPANFITELKDDEHIEPSVIGKVTSYFNIFECGRNLLDQLDVAYQRAFMASPVQEGYYQPSPERERYYDKLVKSLINSTVGSDGTINNDNLNEAITQFKAEKEAGNEHNILDMTQVDEYMSPGKNKDASTVNDLAYHNSDECEDEISDSIKQVEAIKEPITDTHVCNTSIGTTIINTAVIGVGIIGQGGVASPKA